ncbi:hypothetical protein [Burkholderia vietnamiensis]|jgi:hypothetical protein|nr:hypothetical protein [Burkholderia vietnamiensis]AOJ17105.1 hypothetical protein WJ02_25880 [Burkholderia vietnamiensis]MBR8219852.1 hypothetical protein [Burkholderia vietnamiensis]MBR8284622.1 hypothetical protein [Burkholderia vietnamiensis]MCA8016733.1 hypothetical protein [Burkholderia vietnamiensis]MCB4347900.1 hypothetical protein [Burkholderia vietnamiensis]
MDRTAFLEQRPVAEFVTWLVEHLPTLPVRLRFAGSRFVPGGLDVQVNGIEDVLAHYCWRSAWIDPDTGRPIDSHNWETTRASLQRLSIMLRASVAGGDDGRAGAAACEVLRWGGVSSAIPFIRSKVRQRTFCTYLQSLAPLFALDGSQKTDDLHARNIERFDSGMTKVHAVYDTTGSPIYDSRVGAALAMLYELFRRDAERTGIRRDLLGFPSGQARGAQIRDPGELGFARAPQFYTNQVPRAWWARWQVRAGWIIRAVLEQTTLFTEEPHVGGTPPIQTRCHAFEAALFMIGYDIRSLAGGGGIVVPDDASMAPGEGGNWVPAGHPFSRVLSIYRAYRETEPANSNAEDFEQWLGAPEHAARYDAFRQNFRNYCYPFDEREFDLHVRSLKEIQSIENGSEHGLRAANNGEPEFVAGAERVQVCFVCAGLAGYCMLIETTPDARKQRLIKKGFAGTNNSAGTLMSVGRGVGRHFGLLDNRNRPTARFFSFFGEGFDDFRDRLGVDRD